MYDFFRIFRLISGLRSLIAEESLLPKNAGKNIHFPIRIIKIILDIPSAYLVY